MFRQIAPHYDKMNHVLSGGVDIYWRWRAVRSLCPVADRPILDVCCGTGDLALAISKRFGARREVVGSDFCVAMLDIAREKSNRNGEGSGAEFIEADAQALPFEDNRFGAVTVAFGLRNVQDTDQGLREMVRVAAPGGHVMVLEFSKPRTPGLKQGYNAYFTHVLPRVGQYFAKNDKAAYDYLPASVGEFPDGRALADRMTAAGLIRVRYKPLTFGVATIYEGFKPSGDGA